MRLAAAVLGAAMRTLYFEGRRLLLVGTSAAAIDAALRASADATFDAAGRSLPDALGSNPSFVA